VIVAACLAVVLAIGGGAWWAAVGPGGPRAAASVPSATATPRSSSTESRPSPTVTTTPTPMPTFNMAQFSLTDPTSPWLIVNKTHPLNPLNYAPSDLVYPDVSYVNRQPMRQEVANALVTMFQAGGTEAGLHFSVQSAYRSFGTQTSVYNDDAAAHGTAYADTDTARPGYSEHQTGMAVDISSVPASCSLDACFGTTPAGQWLAANAWRFGFLLRYPADKVDVTGFTYEPWHFRYIGVPLATEMHNRSVTTLEEFFGVAGGQYPA
jgi:D-alanyl-D-alanine carboxypeptidase